jgi:hypothetical protein
MNEVELELQQFKNHTFEEWMQFKQKYNLQLLTDGYSSKQVVDVTDETAKYIMAVGKYMVSPADVVDGKATLAKSWISSSDDITKIADEVEVLYDFMYSTMVDENCQPILRLKYRGVPK